MKRPDTIRVSRRGLALGLGSFLLLTGVMRLASENVTLTTSYPSPSGIYQGLTTTGGGGQNTVLARDSGSVGIRTANPQALLDVNGNALVRGGVTTAGLTNNGIRTGLQGRDGGGWHWLMSGGMTEGVHNALGFHAGTRQVAPGPGWTLAGANVRAWSGFFSGVGPSGTMFVPLGFRPTAATCGANVIGRSGSWCHPRCWYSLGPNYIVFHQQMMDGPQCQGTWASVGWWSYSVLVIGQ